MKKILALALAAVMAVSLAACGGSSKPAETKAAETTAAPAATAASVDTNTVAVGAVVLARDDIPEDEIYTALEETAPIMTLMTAKVNGETWPQCCETVSPWKGRIVSFIPGHLPVCTENPDLVYNVELLIRYLRKP